MLDSINSVTSEAKDDRSSEDTPDELDGLHISETTSVPAISVISNPSPTAKTQGLLEDLENPTYHFLESEFIDEDPSTTEVLPGSKGTKRSFSSSIYSSYKIIQDPAVTQHVWNSQSAPLLSSKKNIFLNSKNTKQLDTTIETDKVPSNDVLPTDIQLKTISAITPNLKFLNQNHNIEKSAADKVDSQRQAIQHSLLRRHSIGAPQNDLQLYKLGLSRSKSIQSKNLFDSSSDGTPLLFSQSKEIISRNGSILKTNASLENDDANEGSGLENSTGDFHGMNDDEKNSLKFPYNPLTVETELNCLKPKKKDETKKGRFSNLFTPPFRNFYKAEDPLLNKTSGKNFWNRETGGSNGGLKKNEHIQYVIIWILFVLLMASLCTFIPFIVIFSRGTGSTVASYLANVSPEHRNRLLKEYLVDSSSVKQQSTQPLAWPVTNNDTSTREALITPDLTSSIAGITNFFELPEKYRTNNEIISVMNNTSLRNVFYGIDYAPKKVIYPMCGVTLHDVVLDMALLSQVTSRVRTYGTQCNQAKFILDSIKALNLNVSLALGVWIGPDDDINKQQMDQMKVLLKLYPRKYFESLYIGNEVLFREDQTPNDLANYIKEAKSFVVNELHWNLPVGTSELGSKANIEVMEVSDIFGSNTHPFFNGDSVENSTRWVYDFVEENVEPLRARALKKKQPNTKLDLVISEVGWPYGGGQFHEAVAGKRQMQYFLNHWICESKKKNTSWYFFEAFDEPWKRVYNREGAKWETEWGIFTKDRKLKDGLTFPTC